MIEVYGASNTNYNRNGDVTLIPVSCIFYGSINGEIRIELTCRYDSEGRWKLLEGDNVIACHVPWSKKQLFRIYDREKKTREITAYARHIYFDLIHYPIFDRRPTNKNGEEALAILLEGTGFTGHSNILTLETAYWIRKNVLAAMSGDDENSFLNRWGGEILPDNYDIYIYDRIGQDNGVCARFGHNLREIQETISMDSVVTRIIPVGYDGIMLDGEEPWVDSPNISAYPLIRAQFITYEDIKVKESPEDEEGYDTLEEAQKALKAAAEADFAAGIDQPEANYIVDMAQLANTTEYANYKVLEDVSLGDTIKCKHSGVGIDISARCISIEWDCIKRRNRQVEIGNYISTYFDQLNTTEKQAASAEAELKETYTKKEVNEMLQKYLNIKYVTEAELQNALKGYTSDSELKSALKDYISESELKSTLKTKMTQQQNGLQSNPISAVCHMIDVCNTYVGNKGLWYGNYNTAFNQDCTKGERKNGTETDVVKYRIDCSSFAMLALRGIFFENSRYKGNENKITSGYVFDEDTEYNKNRKYGGGGLLANEIAEYAYEHNFLRRFYAYNQEDIASKRETNPEWEDDIDADIYNDVHAGDLIFFRNSSTKGYWQNIGHVAVVVDVKNNFLHCYEATSTIYIDTDDGKDYFAVGYSIYKKTDFKSKDIQFFARFPLQESNPNPADVFPVNIANINDNISDSEENFKIDGKYLVVSANSLTSPLQYRVNIYPKKTGLYTAACLLEESDGVNAYVWDIDADCRAKSPDGRDSKTDTGGGTKVYLEAGKTYRLNTRIITGKTFDNLKCLPMVYPGVISRKEIGYTGDELSIFDVIERLNKG